MKHEYSSLLIVIIYMLIMLTVCFFTVKTIKEETPDISHIENTGESVDLTSQTIYIPVYIGTSSYDTETENTETKFSDTHYIVKEYNSQIGIFGEDGKLIRLLDVYTKTLPKADRQMLEEGIDVIGNKELNDIIEDYTG